MDKLRTSLTLTKIQRLTPLKPKVKNEKRWSFTYQMINWQVELRYYVRGMNCDDFDDLCMSQSSKRQIDQLLSHLHELDEEAQKLEKPDTTIRCARAYFDTVLEEYRSPHERFDPDARIVHDPDFESAVVKIQDN